MSEKIDFDFTEVDKWNGWGTAVLWLVCIISAVMTFVGLRDGQSESFFGQWVLPVMMTSISLSVGLFGWKYMYDQYPKADAKKRRRLHAGMLAIALILISTSSFFGWVGMAGPRAQLHHLQESIDRGYRTLAALDRSVKGQAALIPDLKAQARLYNKREQNEIDHGDSYGRRGRGPVSGRIGEVGDGFAQAAKILKDHRVDSEQNLTEAGSLLAGLRKLTNADMPIGKKTQKAERKLVALNKVFTTLANSPLPSAKAVIKKVGEVSTAGAVVRRKSRKRTEAAFAKIATSAAASKATVLRRMAEIESEVIPITQFKVLDKIDAAMNYPAYCWPFLVFALCADIGIPLGTILLLCILFNRETAVRVSKTPAVEVHDESRSDAQKVPAWARQAQRWGGGGNGLRSVPE